MALIPPKGSAEVITSGLQVIQRFARQGLTASGGSRGHARWACPPLGCCFCSSRGRDLLESLNDRLGEIR